MIFAKRLVLLIVALLLISHCHSQINDNGEYAVAIALQYLADVNGDDLDLSLLMEQLLYFARHPLNINLSGRDELQELMLFTDQQVSALTAYRDTTGPLLTLYELAYIQGFDMESITVILPFITLGNPSYVPLPKLISDGEHNMITRTQQVLEKAEGYKGEQSYYKGSPVKCYTRYRFISSNRLSWGFVAEKDPGEEIFRGSQPNGFDHYSGHILWKGKRFIRSVIIGDYQLQFGQGLVLWSGFALNKSSMATSVKRHGRGILPHTGADENNFFRGIAATAGTDKVTLTLFHSQHKIDANTGPGNVFSSFLVAGYHRTDSELLDKHSVRETNSGLHLSYSGYRLRLGLTWLRTAFDNTYTPRQQPYQLFGFSGRSNAVAGVHYQYSNHHYTLFGEWGVSRGGHMATLNGLTWHCTGSLTLAAIYRHYSTGYHSLKGNAFGIQSGNANETGLYTGILMQISGQWAIALYTDLFRFPWLRYQVNSPSNGSEYLARITHHISQHTGMYVQLRIRNRQANTIEPGRMNALMEHRQTTIRFHIHYATSERVSFRSRYEQVLLQQQSAAEYGYFISQDIVYRHFDSPLSLTLRLALFDSESYNSRIYSYENDLLYAFSIPAFFYQGIRYYANVKYRLSRTCTIWLKYALTRYTNRNESGSGYDIVTGNKKSEIKAQVMFRF